LLVWENMTRIFALKQIFASTCIIFASNRIFACKFVRIFGSEYEQMMWINGVCKYTETCEYEANKIHIRWDSHRSEFKKVANTAHPNEAAQNFEVL
jgi:hypothetical protein